MGKMLQRAHLTVEESEIDYNMTTARIESTCEWKTNSGRSVRCIFHTATMPSGSLIAAGFLLYDAAFSSGYFRTQ